MNSIYNNYLQVSFKTKILLCVFSILVIFTKFSALNIPFYWDETIYYNSSLFNHGLKAFLPPLYEPSHWQGHPPLFELLHFFIYSLMGQSAHELSGHLTALICYLFFSYSLFRLCAKLGSSFFALLSITVIFVNPHIFSYSTQLFPNFLMLGFGILALVHYEEKLFKTSISLLCCCLMTRESGLAFNAAILLHFTFRIFRKDYSLKQSLPFLIPTLILALFFFYNHTISENLINHPVVNQRLKDGYSYLSFKHKSYEQSILAITQSTFFYWNPLFLFSLPIFVLMLFNKGFRQRVFNFKTSELLLYFTTLSFTIFFFLYNDTIIRDLIILTVTSHIFYLKVADSLFAKEKFKIFTLLSFFIFYTFSINKFYVLNLTEDSSQFNYETRALSLRKYIKALDNDSYRDKEIYGSWPIKVSLKLYEDIYGHKMPRFASKPEHTSLVVDSNILSLFGESLEPYVPGYKSWERVFNKDYSRDNIDDLYFKIYVKK